MAELKKYFYKCTHGTGMDKTGLIESDKSLDAIDAHVRLIAIENAQDFGFEQDEDHFGDFDHVGCDWDEEEEIYYQEGFLEYYVEYYDPEEHDGEVYSIDFELV